MTVTGRTPGGRYSPEQRQEDRSEGQLKERFAELGWPCDRLGRDLGEDLNVRIYDEGAWSGLTFLVQLKSTADSAALKRKRSPTLAYELEVKDLLHWEVSTTLVVLVIWDVKMRTGWWRPIPEIIKDLDASTKGWRKNKTGAVSVPLANGTDDAGLKVLRRAVARHNLPLVQGDKSFALSMSFASTEDGRRGADALREALDEGEPIELKGEMVPHIKWPAWHIRTYGDDAQPVAIQVTPMGQDRSLPVRIEVESPEGRLVYPYVDMRYKKSGNKRLVMSNQHQQLALLITLEMLDEETTLTFSPRYAGHDVYELREAAAFTLAFKSKGAVVRISNLTNGELMLESGPSESVAEDELLRLRNWHAFTDRLCFVQQRMAKHGRLSIEGDLTPAEVATADKLFGLFRSGAVERTVALTCTIQPSERAVPLGDGPVFIRLEGATERFLGVDIPLGEVKQTIQDREHFVNAVQDAMTEANSTGKDVRVDLKRLRVLEEYLDWLPERPVWDAVYEALIRLSADVGRYDGYFTRADARAAGMSDTVFEAALREEKIEPISADVYHLVQFPHAENEELMTLWLQTDRRGVLSHDTALFLHKLSDILPRRSHVTVPFGWDPGERKLDDHVVLYHGEVGHDEIDWIGPVPYTAPLRTLRDCIATHLSPDLIEQAIAEGLERGLFTEADLLRSDERKGAA